MLACILAAPNEQLHPRNRCISHVIVRGILRTKGVTVDLDRRCQKGDNPKETLGSVISATVHQPCEPLCELAPPMGIWAEQPAPTMSFPISIRKSERTTVEET